MDLALRHGLKVMSDLPWTNHVAFLNEKKKITRQVRNTARSIANHPALLCYSLGNEIPAPIVRYYGKKRIESFLRNLYLNVKTEDPNSLVTYVNYPTTEYLELPFLDIVCFNVYLESKDAFDSYIARLHNIACNQPLIISEIGLDSRRNGFEKQSSVINWQLSSCFASGCAGSFVFQWTDEWFRGAGNITDWDFGITTRSRKPKPALASIRYAYSEVPFPAGTKWPKISVVVCTHNGSFYLRETLDGLSQINYPNYEVIVVNDGSTDDTPDIASAYGNVRLITTEHVGLSKARNIGCHESIGDIVAYIDDDAYPDTYWLMYLAYTFLSSFVAGVGGPNIIPLETSKVEYCVDRAPGNPKCVLTSDREAEHIAGCNMSFRRDALLSINGFDSQFRVAGDDVDLCWRIIEKGWRIGFHPAAVVWHHRRNRVLTYLKQQYCYGKAEALLKRKWPRKYNDAGHSIWNGSLYDKHLYDYAVPKLLTSKKRLVYYGKWGLSLFQSIYGPRLTYLGQLPLMPEWFLIITVTGLLSLIGITWFPLLVISLPLFAITLCITIVQAVKNTFVGSLNEFSWFSKFMMRMLITFLHLSQPVARLIGRSRYGLSPWRGKGEFWLLLPIRREYTIWSESWRSHENWLQLLYDNLFNQKIVVKNGGCYDRWDIQVAPALLSQARTLIAIEEHGKGRQVLRFCVWPVIPPVSISLVIIFATLSFWSFMDGSVTASMLLGAIAAIMMLIILRGARQATSCFITAIEKIEDGSRDQNGLQ
jgi:glycosyltransferase involved in cell wall biosynthesis